MIGRDSGEKHGVVAGPFAFLAKPSGGKPHQWVKPVQCAGEFGTDLQQPVIARDVREFVGENDATAAFGPLRGTGRKKD